VSFLFDDKRGEDMADRDDDLALLNQFAGEPPVSKGVVASLLICAGLVWILAAIISLLGISTTIVVAFLLSVIALKTVLNYYVVGPLVRETQRLRAELEVLRSQERVAAPGVAADTGCQGDWRDSWVQPAASAAELARAAQNRRRARSWEAPMFSTRYIQITSHEAIKAIDVSTQIHFLLTPGEARNPDAPFRDLTVGGVDISGEDERYNIHLLSSKRVTTLANALQTQSWESLDKQAKAGQDIMPGWHVGLRPDFENLRDFFSDASEKGYAVLRISSKR
jgi:hypothetical protein